MTFALCFARILKVLTMKDGIGGLKSLDQPLTDCGVRCGCDFGIALGKPLLLLDLHTLPRRIAEHAVEAALGEHLREREVPVKELVMVRERSVSATRSAGSGRPAARSFRCPCVIPLGARFTPRFAKAFLDDESGAPSVGELLLVAILLGLLMATEGQLLRANVLGPIVRQFLQRGGGLLKPRLRFRFLF